MKKEGRRKEKKERRNEKGERRKEKKRKEKDEYKRKISTLFPTSSVLRTIHESHAMKV